MSIDFKFTLPETTVPCADCTSLKFNGIDGTSHWSSSESDSDKPGSYEQCKKNDIKVSPTGVVVSSGAAENVRIACCSAKEGFPDCRSDIQ